MVWHHRRNSIRAYWKQQRGYGKAEALLETKWPDKYNRAGHIRWGGRLYGAGVVQGVGLVNRVYHGMWNSAPFQRLYQAETPLWQAVAQMPEWYLANALLIMLVSLGFSWTPLFWLSPFLLISLGVPVAQVIRSISRTTFTSPRLAWLAFLLYAIQPIARLRGRLSFGLNPLRVRHDWRLYAFLPLRFATWTETWKSPEHWLSTMMDGLTGLGARVSTGGSYDGWDLEIAGGLFGGVRLVAGIEEHGSGKQLVRWRASAWVAREILIIAGVLGAASWGRRFPAAWSRHRYSPCCRQRSSSVRFWTVPRRPARYRRPRRIWNEQYS